VLQGIFSTKENAIEYGKKWRSHLYEINFLEPDEEISQGDTARGYEFSAGDWIFARIVEVEIDSELATYL